MIPDFFLPGAGKSGTSTLAQYLSQHPSICMSEPKEPMFFSHDRPNAPRLGMVGFNNGFDAYERCFSHYEEGTLRGEASTSYMFLPGVIERLLQYAPEARFVFVFRNLVDRVYSHYNFNRQLGSENRPFPEAFEASMDLKVETWGHRGTNGGYYYYYQNGLSGTWLDEYIQNFGAHLVLVISFEELKNSPLVTMNSVFRFLGIGEIASLHVEHANKTKQLKYPNAMSLAKGVWQRIKRTPNGRVFDSRLLKDRVLDLLGRESPIKPLTGANRTHVADFFREDVARLEELTSRSWSEWKDF